MKKIFIEIQGFSRLGFENNILAMLAFNGAIHTWNRSSDLTVTLVDTPQVIPAIYLRAASSTPDGGYEPWSTLVRKLNKKLGIATVMSEGSIHVSEQNGNYTIGVWSKFAGVQRWWETQLFFYHGKSRRFWIRFKIVFRSETFSFLCKPKLELMRRDYRLGILENLLDVEASIDRDVTMILSFVISIVTQRN